MSSKFVFAPIQVFQDRRLTHIQLKVLLAIYSFRDNKTTKPIMPKRRTICSRIGMYSEALISRTTTELAELGWLNKSGSGGFSKSTTYEIVVPDFLLNSQSTVTESATVKSKKTLTEPQTVKPSKTVTKSDTVKPENTITESQTATESQTVTESVTPTVTESVTPTVTDSVTVNPNNGYRIGNTQFNKPKNITNHNKQTIESARAKKFKPPSLEQVRTYMEERTGDEKLSNLESEKFLDHYKSNGWHVGEVIMDDWNASIRKWLGNIDNFVSGRNVKSKFSSEKNLNDSAVRQAIKNDLSRRQKGETRRF